MCVAIKAVGVPWEKNPILTAQNQRTNSARVNSTDFEKKLHDKLFSTNSYFCFDGAKLEQFITGIMSIRESLTM